MSNNMKVTSNEVNEWKLMKLMDVNGFQNWKIVYYGRGKLIVQEKTKKKK